MSVCSRQQFSGRDIKSIHSNLIIYSYWRQILNHKRKISNVLKSCRVFNGVFLLVFGIRGLLTLIIEIFSKANT